MIDLRNYRRPPMRKEDEWCAEMNSTYFKVYGANEKKRCL